MKILLLVLLVLGSGCGKTLRPDPAPPAYESNYPTAEFHAGGRRWVGLGEVQLEPNRPYNEVDLKIQGYGDGVIVVDSSSCSVQLSFSYKDNELVRIPLLGFGQEDCLIDFLVQPRYPSEWSNGVEVHAFKGRLRVRVLSEPWLGFHTVLQEGADGFILIAETEPVFAIFRGCGSQYERDLVPQDGHVKIWVSELGMRTFTERCTLEGKVGDTWVSWQVWFHKPEFAKLPAPSIQMSEDQIKIKADPAVSIVSLDQKYSISSSAKFDFNPSQPHILRILTVKGRSWIAEWIPSRRVWQWIK